MCFALLFSTTEAGAQERVREQNQCSSQPAVKLKEDLRKLWIDHTIWTRNYYVSALADLEDTDKVLARLLQNQEDLGNAIKPYYGEDAGNKLTELLREHILIAGNIVQAAKIGNQEDLKKFNTEWYKNADDIAQFLSSANPNWTNEALKELLHMHLQLVTEGVVARIHKDWDADISAFDKGEDHIIVMADALTQGIIEQFPDQF
ncbi:glycosyltransferase [Alkalihalophilus lindianensis]|uniref:Glycosyltransferase n=1 Tax=Alkalihalophilus lindianensis TaxID=1630542 RepID=A0ABU3X5F0_9BACI|nr:glycosyltransferase [Alkalihalophilus lindianensis]MDV2682847.1 glycosyltransferase [Alkalihalophilus lindianensis]